MSESISKLIAELNSINKDLIGKGSLCREKQDSLDDAIDGALEYCCYGLKGIGKLIVYAGVQNEECALPQSALCDIGNLVTDLAEVIERCNIMKFKEEVPKP